MGIGIAYVDGPRLARSRYAAADWVQAGREESNRLNVFPVPDGDTGTNFSRYAGGRFCLGRAVGYGHLAAGGDQPPAAGRWPSWPTRPPTSRMPFSTATISPSCRSRSPLGMTRTGTGLGSNRRSSTGCCAPPRRPTSIRFICSTARARPSAPECWRSGRPSWRSQGGARKRLSPNWIERGANPGCS